MSEEDNKQLGEVKIRHRVMNKPKNYEVGYKKAPKSTQFKKGKSGNPKGRPKKKLTNIKTQLFKMLETEFVTVKQGNTTKKIPLREAIAQVAIKKAMEGDYRALKRLMDIDMEGFYKQLEKVNDNGLGIIKEMLMEAAGENEKLAQLRSAENLDVLLDK